jgi:hypothetical protein
MRVPRVGDCGGRARERAATGPTAALGCVTPAFLALNKSPNKSRGFSKTVQLSSFALSKPWSPPPLLSHARRTCCESRQPVRLVIAAVPKIMSTPEKTENPQKPFL